MRLLLALLLIISQHTFAQTDLSRLVKNPKKVAAEEPTKKTEAKSANTPSVNILPGDFEAIAFQSKGELSIVSIKAAPDNSGDKLHAGAANPFATEIGDKLKKYYPAKVRDGSISVELKKNGQGNAELIYRAIIERCSEEDAEKFFGHRGSFTTWIVDPNEATKDAYNRAVGQLDEAAEKFETAYGSTRIKSANAMMSYKGKSYALYEFFLMSKGK